MTWRPTAYQPNKLLVRVDSTRSITTIASVTTSGIGSASLAAIGYPLWREQIHAPEFHVSDPLESARLTRSCAGPVIARHPLQRSLRDDYLMWLRELVQIGRNVRGLAKNIAAV